MTVFKDLALIYDQAIDWAQRLDHELPFFSTLVKDLEKPRILDMACGSGRHAVALTLQGFDVIGLDSSPQMIAAAEKHAEINHVNVEFIIADMQNITEVVESPFNLILCIGNSLALLPSHQTVQTTLQGAHSFLGKNGKFVAQILNFDEIRHSGFRFFPLKTGQTTKGDEVVFVRFFEPITNSTTAQLVFTGFIKTSTGWQTKTITQPILQLTQPILTSLLQNAGFESLSFYADYNHNPFVASESRNLIAIASK
jgi:glycine/sarcosine N-methyltransferase